MNHQKIQEFTENASPDNWLKYADELKQSALRLWKDKNDKFIDFNQETNERKERPAISRSFMLVAGLSIENVLKAYLVSISPSLINKGFLDNKLKVHDLLKLTNLITDIEFYDTEIELMKVFSEAIPYWGRYPIPLHFNNIKTEKIVDDEIYTTYKELFKKVFYKTLDKIKNGWDAGNGVGFLSHDFRSFEEE